MTELTIDREFDDLCPSLTEDEERLLEQSLEADGCLHSIVLWANHDDTILDGHNRYRLCKKHGIKFTTKAIRIDGRDEAKAWILRTQIGRRNLTESQKAMLAAKIVTLTKGDNQHAPVGATSQSEAAEAFGVGKRTVQRAEKVLEQGAKCLQKAVEEGDVSLRAAEAISELPKAEQARVVAKGPEAVAAKAKKLKAADEPKKYNDPFDPAELDKQKPKNGSEKKSQFKDSLIDELLGKLMRAVDDRWNKNGGHGNKYRICVEKLRAFGAAWTDWRKS